MELYTYEAKANRVVDGDTIDMSIDLGFKITWRVNCRLAGINAPELSSVVPGVKEAAYRAKSYVESKIQPGDKIRIKSQKLDKYGRAVVTLFYGKDFSNNLNEEMIAQSLAVKYMAD